MTIGLTPPVIHGPAPRSHITFFLELEAGTSGRLLNTEQFPMRNAGLYPEETKQHVPFILIILLHFSTVCVGAKERSHTKDRSQVVAHVCFRQQNMGKNCLNTLQKLGIWLCEL